LSPAAFLITSFSKEKQMTSKTRTALIQSGNIRPAAVTRIGPPVTAIVRADPSAIKSRFNELNKRKVESAVAVLKAASLRPASVDDGDKDDEGFHNGPGAYAGGAYGGGRK
jgi:hypothetical protein